MKKENIKQA